jgi:cytidyltransferase-like protein
MNEENAKKLLFEIDDILNEIGIVHFLYGGTCLGAVRDKRFIPVDLDIDIACVSEQFVPKANILKEILLKRGYDIHWLDHRHKKKWDGSSYGVKIKKYGVSCDFVAFFPYDKDRRYNPSHFDEFIIVHKKEYIENLTGIEFYGRKFFVPRDYDGYLTEKYCDWRKPHKKFYNVSVSRIYDTVMTCGGFDLCHFGHINILRQARERCKKLIVCISSDERILEKKKKLPLLSYDDRVYLVKLTGYADIIDKIDVAGKKPLIDKYKPEALLIGNDWTPDTYEGSNLLPVIFVQHTNGLSSTWYREHIRKEVC